MATITFNIDDARLVEILDAVSVAYNYTGFAPDSSVENKNQFLRRVFLDNLKSVILNAVKNYRIKNAGVSIDGIGRAADTDLRTVIS